VRPIENALWEVTNRIDAGRQIFRHRDFAFRVLTMVFGSSTFGTALAATRARPAGGDVCHLDRNVNVGYQSAPHACQLRFPNRMLSAANRGQENAGKTIARGSSITNHRDRLSPTLPCIERSGPRFNGRSSTLAHDSSERAHRPRVARPTLAPSPLPTHSRRMRSPKAVTNACPRAVITPVGRSRTLRT
jgi:hypothetical protein